MKLRRPPKWQDEMAEVRELFKRVDRVRQGGFTGFSTWESPPPSASTLSRNRLRRHRALCSMELSHLNFKEAPFEALNHLQNIRGMCTRIQRQDYPMAQKKKDVDLVHQPPLLRKLEPTKKTQKSRNLKPPFDVGRSCSASGCPQVGARQGKPMAVEYGTYGQVEASTSSVQEEGHRPLSATKSCSRSSTDTGKHHRIPGDPGRCHSKCCCYAPTMCGSWDGSEHPPPCSSMKEKDSLFPTTSSMWCHTRDKEVITTSTTSTSTFSSSSVDYSTSTRCKSSGSCHTSSPLVHSALLHVKLAKEQEKEKPSSRRPIFDYSSHVRNSSIGSWQESSCPVSPSMTPPVVNLVFDSLLPKPSLCFPDPHETTPSPLTDLHLETERIGDTKIIEELEEDTIVRQVAIAAADSPNVLIKHSSDPYNDFHLSMVSMIEEEGLQECEAELEELFQYYLDLNPKGHHEVLHKVIGDIRTDYLLKRSIE